MADMHSAAKKDASFGAHHKNLNDDFSIDPYYQRRKCRPMTLVSGNIRFMRIFAGAGPYSEGVTGVETPQN